MNPSKKRVIKNIRSSPKVPAEFDSESEDQNGLHPIHSTSARIPLTSSYKTPRQRTHHKDNSELWGLDVPSGTDSGVCSSDRTVPWSPDQHPSKTKSTLIMPPDAGQSPACVALPVQKQEQREFRVSILFHLIPFIASCVLLLILYNYFFINMNQFRNSLATLSEELQAFKVVPSEKYTPSSNSDSSEIIQQELAILKKDALSLAGQQQSLSQIVNDTRDSIYSQQDKLNKNLKTTLSSLELRVEQLESTTGRHTNQFFDFSSTLFQHNKSLEELDKKLFLLNSLMDQFNSTLNYISSPNEINLNHIDEAFARHYQDQLGMYDFALGSAGGRIVNELTSETYSGSEAIRAFGFTLFSLSNSPDVVLEPTVLPGSCWPFSGSGGVLGIKLTHQILLRNITIDHVPNELTDDGSRSSAPKDFLVRGISILKGNGINLGTFSFKKDSLFPFQTFIIPNSFQNERYSLYQIKFISNHGHMNLTCIYRVRLHGSLSH